MKKMKGLSMAAVVAVASLLACNGRPKAQPQDSLTQSGLDARKFEAVVDGDSTHLFTLKNSNGMEVCITNFGGRIVSVTLPDRNGEVRDVVLGFDNIGDYVNVASDFGATIGRYANRIGNARFTLDGETIALPDNNDGNCLHGGPKGWQYKVFAVEQATGNRLDLKLVSPHGDMNFPGEVTARVSFTLSNDNALRIAYSAVSDRKTVINMTNHSYFNLSGDHSRPATDHVLYVNADRYTPVNNLFIPNGPLAPVAGTPMDFTTPKAIAQDVENTAFEQIKLARGFDHNWVLNTQGDPTQLAAKATCTETGIGVEVYTNEPGIQVYTGNFLDGKVTGKRGIAYPQRAAVCLETQHYPDSPNKPDYPSVVLEPGKTYQSECTYKFTVE